jgi:integrase
MTLDECLASWHARQRSQLQHSTWRTYADVMRRYLSPMLGDVPLAELDPLRVEQFYADLFERGGVHGKGLSIATVRYVHAVLHKALADGVRLRVVDVNVTDFAQLPRRPADTGAAPALRVWSAEQAQRFLRLVTTERLGPLWGTALGTGMRRGELLGLSWHDVDLEGRTVRVHRSLSTLEGTPQLKSTKTGRPRTISLDLGTADRLAAWRVEQRRELREVPRVAVDWDPVFAEPDGAPHLPMRITSAFRRLARRLPLPVIRLHDLRHTHASLLLQAGVSIKVVSERLGHRTIALTMDTYTHVMPAMDRDAADRLGYLIGSSPTSTR